MTTLSAGTRDAVIKALIEKTGEYYILPDKASEFVERMQAKFDAGDYEQFTDVHQFASQLTSDMQAIIGDRHLGVNYSPEMYDSVAKYEANPDDFEPDANQLEKMIAQSRYNNCGFERVERLSGNIGYIRLDGFHHARVAGDTAVAAMNFVAHCDALIFDLRHNGGGDPSMIQLISSYLFNESTHLNNFYDRHPDKTQQFWTQSHVQGKKMPDIPVYILTSSRTFSAAEEFTFNLKNLKRATVIGETTGGGGHPVTGMTLADGFVARICRARAVNPITNDNWEGTGVAPHIEVPQQEAPAKAHWHAIQSLLESDDSEEQLAKRKWASDTVKARYQATEVDSDTLKSYEGRYGGFVITAEDNRLRYTMRGFPGELTAISENCFLDLNHSHFRLEFIRDDEGSIAIKVHHENSPQTPVFPRTEN